MNKLWFGYRIARLCFMGWDRRTDKRRFGNPTFPSFTGPSIADHPAAVPGTGRRPLLGDVLPAPQRMMMDGQPASAAILTESLCNFLLGLIIWTAKTE